MLYGYGVLKKKFDFSERAKLSEIRPILQYLVFTFLATASLTLFNNIDILLVRQYFDEESVGIYSCAALFGKIILYIPAVLATMLFPMTAKNDGNRKKLLFKTLVYSGVISFFAAVVLYVFRDLIIRIIMGSQYEGASVFVLPLTGVILPLVLVTVLVNYLVAKGDKWFVSVSCIVSVIAILCAAALRHNAINELLYILAAVFVLLFIVLLIRSILSDE